MVTANNHLQHVRINAGVDVGYGEELLVCGSAASLGSWDLSKAASMKWQEKGLWTLTAPLPCGVRVELKICIQPQGGSVRWLGVGHGGANNIVLETSLGRTGAQKSRFGSLEGLPLKLLEVQDLDEEEASTELGKEVVSEEALAVQQNPQNHGQNHGQGQSNTSASFVQPSAEVAAAFMLAGQAGAAGHAVTYTTTTTTTTAVTVNGMCPTGCPTGCPAGPPMGPAITYSPPAAGPQNDVKCQSAPAADASARGHQNTEPTQEEKAALIAARERNSDIPRAGPAPLEWKKNARDVRVRGSWDGWKRELTLEPCSGGGFRAMLVLPAGEYHFKFIVDGNWKSSEELECTKCANKNNILRVSEMVFVPVPIGSKGHFQSACEDSTESAVVVVD
eukprot:TRINITY_DN3157_c0_g1_i1.p1 TRINITY_DN3157_c0_g1~~TRINITY_DN3157_c0_g1_i1.p1  ORF type:complete len:391 (-),score=77.99 TRINITY_DN3157_c0_g1_i1:12-1184(-)